MDSNLATFQNSGGFGCYPFS